MWFLTVDRIIWVSVFIAKLSERQYCWRVIEDFHSQEYIQLFDIHNCLFMRLHFSIGGYDYRRTTRLISSKYPFQHYSSPFCWSCALTLRSRQQILFPQVSTLMVQASTYFPKVRRMLFYLSRSILGYFWPTSTLLRGHIALATPSLPETDPQILEHWGYADEDHLGKSFQAMDFGLEF